MGAGVVLTCGGGGGGGGGSGGGGEGEGREELSKIVYRQCSCEERE